LIALRKVIDAKAAFAAPHFITASNPPIRYKYRGTNRSTDIHLSPDARNHSREIKSLERARGFEPPDLRIWNPVLYQPELRSHPRLTARNVGEESFPDHAIPGSREAIESLSGRTSQHPCTKNKLLFPQ
jgi:hypothetical protein